MTTVTPDVEAELSKLRASLVATRRMGRSASARKIQDRALDMWIELVGVPLEPRGGWRSAR